MLALSPSRRDAGSAALIALGGIAVVICASLFDGSFVLPDSAQYLSMAKNLMAGNGVATSLVWTEEHYRLGGLPVAQTNLPPGYPILIALVGLLGVDPMRAAFFVSLVCFGAIPLVIYQILRAGGRPALQCLAVSGVWLVLPAVWSNVMACLSEMSYTLSTVLSLACVVRSERDPAKRNTWLILAGTLAGLAFTIRYAGIIYLASLGALFLLRAARRRDARSIRELVLVGGPPTVFVVALFARNYQLAGRFAGGALVDEGNSILAVLQSVYWSVSQVSGFSKAGLLRGEVPDWLFVVFVVSVFGCLAAGLRLTVNGSALRAMVADTRGSLSVIYVVGSLCIMIILAKAHAAGTVHSRYLLPLIPFALLLVPNGLELLRCASATRGQTTMAAALRWGALAVFLAGQASVLGDLREDRRESPYRYIDHALHQPFGSATLRDFLSQQITLSAPLLGNAAQLTGAVLDRPVVGLSGPWYTRRVWTEDEARRVVAKYGVTYVVFFPDLFDLSQPDLANQIFFRDLQQGKVPSWLQPTFSSASVRLYQVNASGA
jgi:4-amino-4-deoxy-L-arabinose transferase-like glycosyltransferase